MKILFNAPDEFLAELRIDAEKVEQKILRVTVRHHYRAPFVEICVLASAVIGPNIVVLEHHLGQIFVGEQLAGSEVGSRTELVTARLREVGEGLGLEVRAGVYEPVSGE